MKTPFVKSLQRARGWCDRAASRQIGYPFGAGIPNAPTSRVSMPVLAALRQLPCMGQRVALLWAQGEWYHGSTRSRLTVASRAAVGLFVFSPPSPA